MFEVLCGRRPFVSSGDPMATLMMHAEEPPPSLKNFVSDLPEEMVQLVDTMLAKDPASRPSLAAVRTVIKRLRTTQLPGRTLALELSASRLPQPELAHDSMDISASRLGADSILPGDSKPLPQLPSTVAGGRKLSQPPFPRAPTPVSDVPQQMSGLAPTSSPLAKTKLGEPPMKPPSVPPANRAGAFAIPPQSSPAIPLPGPHSPSMPPTSLASIQGSLQGNSTPSINQSMPPTPSGSLFPPAQSTHGARGQTGPNASLPPTKLPGTEIGVPPAPKQGLTKPAAPSSSRLWLIIGAAIFIAAGIGLAIVLVG
jgi:hypothetical protein